MSVSASQCKKSMVSLTDFDAAEDRPYYNSFTDRWMMN